MDKTAIQAGTPPTVHGHANAIQASAPAPRPTAVTEVRPAKAP